MVCAFRYALDRKTGALTDMLERIEPYWGCLSPGFQGQIKRDIQYKIGMDEIKRDDMESCRRILAL